MLKMQTKIWREGVGEGYIMVKIGFSSWVDLAVTLTFSCVHEYL